jgi:hypothetical protein
MEEQETCKLLKQMGKHLHTGKFTGQESPICCRLFGTNGNSE